MGLASAAAIGQSPSAASGILTAEQLGYNAALGEYTLPDLPYAYDALEPYIDEQTMKLHHDKHHASYVRGLNKALEWLEAIRQGNADASLLKHYSRQLAFNGSGHINHMLFWLNMAPVGNGGGGTPDGLLAEAIDANFGSYAQFAAHFKTAAASVEGSGWAWLVHEPVANRLLILQTEKHQNLTISGVRPLLGVDVWEHAYYLKYQNRRSDYVSAFLEVVNWPRVAAFYAKARS